jgi:hypothetical protein
VTTLERAGAAALFLAAGGVLYLVWLNRYLAGGKWASPHGRDILPALALFTVASLVAGLLAAGTPWMLVAVLVLVGALIAETVHRLQRRSYAASPPEACEGCASPLTEPLTTTDLAVVRYRLPWPGWRGAPLRIVHVSDLHATDRLPEAFFSTALRRAAAESPDLVLWTGDFVTSAACIPMLRELLPLLRGRLGTFGILGNHDVIAGGSDVIRAAEQGGVRILDGDCVAIEAEGRTIALCDYQFPWWGADGAVPTAPEANLALMLTHTPDNITTIAGKGYAAAFAGHVHAGQLRLPGFGALAVPSRQGRRFDRGHFLVGGTHLYVSAGLGAMLPPVRLFCPADFLVIDVVAQ